MSEKDNRSRQAAEAPRGPSTFKFRPRQLVIIGVDTDDGPEHPLYDPRAFRPLKPERLEMYKRQGIKVPVIFKHMKVKLKGAKEFTDGDVVVDGKGRVRYGRVIEDQQIEAGVATDELILIKGLSERGADEDLFGLSRSLNQHEADSALENAKSVQRMMSFGKDEDGCAHTFGVSSQTIRNWLALLDLAPEVQQEMRQGDSGLAPTAAMHIAQLPRQEQQELLVEIQEEAANGQKPTVERVRAKVAAKQGKPEPNPNAPSKKIEKAKDVLMKLSGISNPTKEDMSKALDKLCRIVAGVATLEKLGDLGD